PAMTMPAGMPMMPPMQFGGGEGVKLVFKNAKISIDRIVFKSKEKLNRIDKKFNIELVRTQKFVVLSLRPLRALRLDFITPQRAPRTQRAY
ncbi:MAG: hypothetical protein Q8N79_06510, partial [Candidatus Methanoperedens sp.]|nr:hypothetical protein [Candidatus Methanoperedens sp.]